MFCQHCGKGEQNPGAYCRNCGELIGNYADKFYLINKILGISSPEKQINLNLIVNLLTAIFSAILIVFLMGYFDARFAKAGEVAPPIIYVVYLFLGLVAGWQFLSFMINVKLKSKLSGRHAPDVLANSPAGEVTQLTARHSLPEADFKNIVPDSVTEETTRALKTSPRSSSDSPK